MMMKKALLAAVLSAAALPVFAACEATLEATDTMQFSSKEIVADASCKEFKLTLTHTGKLPKASMGHNFVLVKTDELNTVQAEAIKAGADNHYIPADKKGVLAHTKLLGGGESDTIVIDLSKLEKGGDYTYFCSFPGHAAIMKGVFKY